MLPRREREKRAIGRGDRLNTICGREEHCEYPRRVVEWGENKRELRNHMGTR